MIHLGVASARQAIDTLAFLLLLTSFGSVLVHRLDHSIILLAVQGALLAAVAVVVAVQTGAIHAYIAVVVTFVVKAVAVPGLMLHALRGVRLKQESELVVARRLALLIAIALLLVAYYAATPLVALDPRFPRNALPIALAMLLIGMLIMLTRKKVLSQIAGLVAMENGLYLAGLVVTRGLPLAVELSVAADVLVGIVVMTLVSRQIHLRFATIDTDRLQSLRG
jgi:hydrogenase-4 component E